jgi:hypothetical protein
VVVVLGSLLCGVGEVLFFSLCCRSKLSIFRVLPALGFLLKSRLVKLSSLNEKCALQVLKKVKGLLASSCQGSISMWLAQDHLVSLIRALLAAPFGSKLNPVPTNNLLCR